MRNTTNRILAIAVALLLVANIALVAVLVCGKRSPKKETDKEKFERAIGDLGLTDAQKKEFDAKRDAHFAVIRPIFDSIRSNRTALFNLVKEPVVNDSLVAVYAQRIAEKQVLADKQTVSHFHSIRLLLDSAQQIKYDEFLLKMLQRQKKDSTNKKEK